ncbi:hypothetical protein [Aeromonas salmonicida]|uniref:hypothetical protein n=1 Tax=Aeromonas salmonicida TaxID=645 RepID=UPI002116C510|nr:hypothetical protein [Aeromonas salmonicida]UUI60384.1 hypothetical protein NP805_20025 [Aeromonas salmonicida]
MEGTVFEICFTGFGSIKKRELIALTKTAQIDQFIVRTEVTKNLDFLCCGKNAGPVKISEAQAQGCYILDEATFINLLETGHINVNGESVRLTKDAPAPEICFTGFGDDANGKLYQLTESAVKHGFVVRNSITNGVGFLCCSSAPDAYLGFAKIAKAVTEGLIVLSDNEFTELLSTGELPQSPWLYQEMFSTPHIAADLLGIIYEKAQQHRA